MENKIEITTPMNYIGSTSDGKDWSCAVYVNDLFVFRSYGYNAEEATANAQIAAKGYLVEELAEVLLEVNNWASEFGMKRELHSKVKKAIAKATQPI